MNQEEINNYTYLKQRYYLSKRNIFLNHQITKLNESAINQTVQRKCESYLSELIEDPYDSQDAIVDIYEVEHNLIDYIVYQYITRDTSLFYDSSKDYHLLRMEAQHLILKIFRIIIFSQTINQITIQKVK